MGFINGCFDEEIIAAIIFFIIVAVIIILLGQTVLTNMEPQITSYMAAHPNQTIYVYN